MTRILIAVDGSGQSERAVEYVGTLLRETPDALVTLFHVLKPIPRELLEHGGSENPQAEDRLSRSLRSQQEEWIQTESAREYPILAQALEVLGKAGFPLDRAATKFGHEEDVVRNILEEARACDCGTIVVGRHRNQGTKRLFGKDTVDRLLGEAKEVTVWVVE
jgi:nucleotide-binding universal stress UspA family protein